LETVYKKIGERMRKIRKEKRISQRELAEKVKMSRTSISHYENAKRRISIHQLEAIENVLEKPLYFFQEEVGYTSSIGSRMALLLESVSEARYLPITGYSNRPGFEAMDLSSKRLIPFPAEVVEGAEFVYGTGGRGDMNLYFISRKKKPDAGDLVLMEYEYNKQGNKPEIMYIVDSYDQIMRAKKAAQEVGQQYKEENKIVGVVKMIMQTGTFGNLTNVEYFEVGSTKKL